MVCGILTLCTARSFTSEAQPEKAPGSDNCGSTLPQHTAVYDQRSGIKRQFQFLYAVFLNQVLAWFLIIAVIWEACVCVPTPKAINKYWHYINDWLNKL